MKCERCRIEKNDHGFNVIQGDQICPKCQGEMIVMLFKENLLLSRKYEKIMKDNVMWKNVYMKETQKSHLLRVQLVCANIKYNEMEICKSCEEYPCTRFEENIICGLSDVCINCPSFNTDEYECNSTEGSVCNCKPKTEVVVEVVPFVPFYECVNCGNAYSKTTELMVYCPTDLFSLNELVTRLVCPNCGFAEMREVTK